MPGADKGRQANGAILFVLALTLLTAGCGEPLTPPPPSANPSSLYLLEPSVTNEALREALRAFDRAYPGVERLHPREIEDGLVYALRENKTLIVPDLESLPYEQAERIGDYVARGGALLAFGPRPLARDVLREHGRWTAHTDRLAALYRGSGLIDGFSTIEDWDHGNNRGDRPGFIRRARGFNGKGIEVQVEALDIWDAMRSKALPSTMQTDPWNTLCFLARGDARTSRLVVHAEHETGPSSWRAFSIKEAWTPIVLRARDFQTDGSDDPERILRRATHLRIGLDNRRAWQGDGEHVFGLSDIRIAFDRSTRRPDPIWPGLDRARSTRPLETRWIRLLPMGALAQPPADVFFPTDDRPLTPGVDGGLLRFEPLAVGVSQRWAAPDRAFPAMLYAAIDANGQAAAWAHLAAPFGSAVDSAFKPAIDAAVERLLNGCVVGRAYCEGYALRAGEELTIAVSWGRRPSAAQTLRYRAELLSASGRPLRRILSPPLRAGETARLSLGRMLAPPYAGAAEHYRVRLTLEHANDLSGMPEPVEHIIKVLPESRQGDARRRLRISGKRLLQGGRPFHMQGVCLDRCDLNPESFDTDRWRRRLARIRDAGINTLLLNVDHPRDGPQLEWILDEADRNELHVIPMLPALDPWAPNPDRARACYRAAHMALHADRIPALAVPAPSRAPSDTLYRDWLSWTAENAIDPSAWPEPGTRTSSLDRAPAGVPEAVWRRFVVETGSRRTGRLKRWMRANGIDQPCMPVARDANAFDPAAEGAPAALWAMAFHADLPTLPGEALTASRTTRDAASWWPETLRAVTGGKPFVWTGLGPDLGPGAGAVEERLQTEAFRQAMGLVDRSYAAGWLAAEWQAASTNADRGLADSAGQPRPLTHDIKAHERAMRERDNPPPPPFDTAWPTHARALGLFEPMSEGNGPSEDRSTTRASNRAPFSERYPFLTRCNAEWDALRIADRIEQRLDERDVIVRTGEPLRARLINTGWSTWSPSAYGTPGSVWVRATCEGRPEEWIEVPETANGSTIIVPWTPPAPGRWTLRPYAWSVGGFGEALNLDVRDA